jgi:hypothetical protein
MPKQSECALFLSLEAVLINSPSGSAVDLARIREQESALQLALHVWLQCDSHLDAAAAAQRRQFAAAQSLSSDLQRVAMRDRSTAPSSMASPFACRCAASTHCLAC